MGGDGVEAEGVHVVDCGVQADRLQDRGRAGLELVRHVRPGGALEADGADHVAAAHERRHRIEQLAPAPQHADPGRAIQLVAGEHEEVGTQRLHVDATVHHGLAAVEQDARAILVRERREAFRRSVGAEHVAHVGDRHQPDAAVLQQALVGSHVQLAAIGDRAYAQLNAVAVAQHLPGHDVGVVLHLRDQHRLARLHDAAAVGVGDQVDRLGAVAGEHHLLARRRVEQAGDGVAGGLVGVGGALAHPVQAAMHVGVLRLHSVDHGVDHGARLLRGGGVVEEHQRLVVHALRQDREVGADRRLVEGAARRQRVGRRGLVDRRGAKRTGNLVHVAAPPWRVHQRSTAPSSMARAPSFAIGSSASARKARTRSERAWASGTPRERR